MPAWCPAPESSVLATLCMASLGAPATSLQGPAPGGGSQRESVLLTWQALGS